MESEFVVLEMVRSEAEWLKNFLANIPLRMKPTLFVSVHCDCQSTITIAKNKTYNGKNRHIDGEAPKCSSFLRKLQWR